MRGKREYTTARTGGAVLDKSIIESIMLRFRPIAPKPAGYGEATSEGNKNGIITKGKGKRKCGRVRKNYKPRKRKKSPSPKGGDIKAGERERFVTLQLLPERSEVEDLVPVSNVIYSRVTVESVTETCVEGEGLGLTDGERLENLAVDTCPGFVSEGFDSVWWVNEAYRKMVMWREEEDGGGGGDHGEWWKKEIRVWLVVKEKERLWDKYWLLVPAFGCRVRVEYMLRDRKCSRTLPCDVWRMECGSFAWRLDVKAALSLGI